jgi:hypothetical protein
MLAKISLVQNCWNILAAMDDHYYFQWLSVCPVNDQVVPQGPEQDGLISDIFACVAGSRIAGQESEGQNEFRCHLTDDS